MWFLFGVTTVWNLFHYIIIIVYLIEYMDTDHLNKKKRKLIERINADRVVNVLIVYDVKISFWQ